MNIADIFSYKTASIAPTNKVAASGLDKSSFNALNGDLISDDDSWQSRFPYDLNNLHPNDAMDAGNWLLKEGVITIDESLYFVGMSIGSDRTNKLLGAEGGTGKKVNFYDDLAAHIEYLYSMNEDKFAGIYSSLLDKLTSAFNPPHPNSSKVHYMA